MKLDRYRKPRLPPSMRSLAVAAAAWMALAPASAAEPPESRDVGWWRDIDRSLPGLRGDWRIYAKHGLRLDSPDGDIRLKLNGSVFVDGGYIGANDAIESALGDTFGWDASLTRARLTLRGWVFDAGDFKVQLEFADQVQIKDAWFGFVPLPYVGRIRAGNMKEPFSLEALTSGSRLTFMTESLPALALAPGRNIGVMAQNAVLESRMTWSIGGFWNTGSFSSFAGAKDAFSESIGFDVTGRVTGLPVYAGEGRRLVHLGLSLSRQRFTGEVAARAQPETRLTDHYFVDTGRFKPDNGTLVAPEFAVVAGPWSAQAEYFVSARDGPDVGNALLHGFYVTASHVLTGEHRRYDRQTGVFTGIVPARPFSLRDGGLGALEIAFRLSHVDLNDGALQGGRETDLSVGVNWYLTDTARFALNYVHARVNDRANPPALEGGRANIVQARIQIDL